MKRKAQYTSGVLCRDMDGDVAFFVGLTEEQVYLDMPLGWWQAVDLAPVGDIEAWKVEGFKELYDLTDENGKPCPPPRKGQSFEAELEL